MVRILVSIGACFLIAMAASVGCALMYERIMDQESAILLSFLTGCFFGVIGPNVGFLLGQYWDDKASGY